MERKADRTKRKILEAAISEFAAFGVAGARVDRIALSAGYNKHAIYSYFGGKDALFEAAFNEMAQVTEQSLPMDPEDLPGYAGRLFDHHQRLPELARLASWHLLERTDNDRLPEVGSKEVSKKVALIRAAQKKGIVTAKIKAEFLLALIYRTAMLSVMTRPELSDPEDSPEDIRASLVECIRRIVAP